jgi:hypothetical protein
MGPETLHHRHGRRHHRVLQLAPLLLLLVLSACGGSGGSGGSAATGDTASSSAGGSTSSSPQLAEGKAAVAGTPGSPVRDAVAPLSRAVISTGQVSLHSSKVAAARSEVIRLVASWGGTVADEQTESDRRGRVTDSTMTLRVPTARFDAAMAGLARVAQVAHQSRTAQDVTTQVIDNTVRVRAARRSISAIEGLLDRATKLSDVISIESDLGRRQADLDSLERQQAWLSDQTSLSTIAVHLSRTPPPVAAKKVEARGFLAGLDRGWSAFGSATLTAFTVLGAVLPFALLALLVGAPLWFVVRRRRPEVASGQS